MHALTLTSIGQLTWGPTPDASPAPHEIVLQTIATGICGSDIHGYTGETGRRVPGQIMGHETVGQIHSLGTEVDPRRYPLGAIATVNPVIVSSEGRDLYRGREQHDPARTVIGVDPGFVSAFAERFCVPSDNVIVLPEHMPVAFGALIEPLAVGLQAVLRVRVMQGETVLVIGGGPIGQSSILAAKRAGASEIYVSEPDSTRRALCESLGAIALDPAVAPIPEQLTAAHGSPVDVAIDAVGISASLADALSSVAFGGRVCLVGMGAKQVDLSAFRVSTEERSIVGSFTYPHSVFVEAAEWVGDGDPQFAKLISAEILPQEADAAFRRLSSGVAAPGKVLIRFD